MKNVFLYIYEMEEEADEIYCFFFFLNSILNWNNNLPDKKVLLLCLSFIGKTFSTINRSRLGSLKFKNNIFLGFQKLEIG